MDVYNRIVEDEFRIQGNIKYIKIKKELNENKTYVNSIVKKIYSKKTDKLCNSLKDIIDDIVFLIETLDYLSYSCDMKNEFGNEFFQFTTFYRISVLYIKNISANIHRLIKVNKLGNKKIIIKMWKEIVDFSENIIKYRNDLEHNIDPFFIEFETFMKFINVSNIVTYLKMVVKLVDVMSKEDINSEEKPEYRLNYLELDLMQKIIKIESLNNVKKDIFTKLNQISYCIRDKYVVKRLAIGDKTQIINEELISQDFERNLFDLSIKQLELNKALHLIYKDSTNKFEGYSGIKIDAYKYFQRLAIIFYYQMFDKFSLYIKSKHKLNINKPYFKDAISEIINKPINLDSIDKKLIELYNSNDYRELKKIRQIIVHMEKNIDFNINSEKISSLIININIKTNYIILDIVNDYLKNNNVQVSREAIIESDQKTIFRKLEV